VLTLAFDTATDVATAALLRDGAVLGERRSRAARVLADVEVLVAEAAVSRADIERIVVGTGPGSYTGLRMGLVTARALSLSLDAPVAGVSTLDALAAGSPGSVPVLDARRGEVFTVRGGEPAVLSPDDLVLEPGRTYVGDGAVRYRAAIEEAGGLVPPDDDEAHVPWARHHAALATGFGPAELVEPLYLRIPDAEISRREGRLRV
jgi:tRNA threonylcarbamoyladenosine biosynthesis protein TsaB